jgi:hypothetical protein
MDLFIRIIETICNVLVHAFNPTFGFIIDLSKIIWRWG